VDQKARATIPVAILAEIELCWNLIHVFTGFSGSIERKDRHRKEEGRTDTESRRLKIHK